MPNINTEFFPPDLYVQIRSAFAYLDKDFLNRDRIFFENSGGSLRLKSVVEEDAKLAAIPDCPERTHEIAKIIRTVLDNGIADIRLFLNAKNGSIVPSSTASKVMFEILSVIAENTKGTNIVTTALEHPSSFDACGMAADKLGLELRVAKVNQVTGSVDVESLLELIDNGTSILSIILTSNITGAIHDIESIVTQARSINPNIYIVVDAVQAAAHGVIDVDRLKIDALNIAPYKMFGNRGVAYAYVSNRVATLPHHRLLATDEENWNVGSPTPSHYAGFSNIIDYICSIGSYFLDSQNRRELIVEGMTRIHQQEQAILNRLIYGSEKVPGIKNIEGVTVHFAEHNVENQDLILALTFDKLTCKEAAEKYGENNILVYDRQASSHYSKRILEAVNLEAIVRVSPLHCHTPNEIDTFLEITKKIAS